MVQVKSLSDDKAKDEIYSGLEALKNNPSFRNGFTQSKFNIFRVLDADRYEVRHGAFFAYLMDTSLSPTADQFVACFLRALYEAGVNSRFAARVSRASATEISTIEVSHLVGYDRFRELQVGRTRRDRMDYAACISIGTGRAKRRLRLVIEFKKNGTVGNPLRQYRRAVGDGIGSREELLCLLIDVGGKQHELADDSFEVIEASVLLQSIDDYVKAIRPHRRDAVGAALDAYREVLAANLMSPAESFSPVVRGLLWDHWPPAMDVEWDRNAEHHAKALKRYFDSGSPEAGYLDDFDWQDLVLPRLQARLGRAQKSVTSLLLKLGDHRALARNGLFCQVAMGLGRNVGLTGKNNKNSLFLRLAAILYQPAGSDGIVQNKSSDRDRWERFIEGQEEVLRGYGARSSAALRDSPIKRCVFNGSGEVDVRGRRSLQRVRFYSTRYYFYFPVSPDDLRELAVNDVASPGIERALDVAETVLSAVEAVERR